MKTRKFVNLAIGRDPSGDLDVYIAQDKEADLVGLGRQVCIDTIDIKAVSAIIPIMPTGEERPGAVSAHPYWSPLRPWSRRVAALARRDPSGETWAPVERQTAWPKRREQPHEYLYSGSIARRVSIHH